MFTYTAGKPVLAVAPMLGRTDRHCRFFHRQLAPHVLLYSEMIVAHALVKGNVARLLAFHPAECPVAVQLGGSDPFILAEAARIAVDSGYDEVNLNAGCPSDRVQAGTFGACLMYNPRLAGECVYAIRKAVHNVPVTVKCRIGVDEQDPECSLNDFAESVFSAGADALWVHARKAWLKGLSPKENRNIPPLDYNHVYALKLKYPDRFIGLNGGVNSCDQARIHFSMVDGVMIGRAAFDMPILLAEIHSHLYPEFVFPVDYERILENMYQYISNHISQGGKLSHVTRHMTGLFRGVAGSSLYRRILSDAEHRMDCGPADLRRAFEQVLCKTSP